MMPLAARRAFVPLAGALALGCQDATAPRTAADALPVGVGTAVVPATTQGDPIPATDRTTFLAAVARRFQGTPLESSANAWAQAAYPPPTPTVGIPPDCASAKLLARQTLLYFATQSLRGQPNNPPLDPTGVVSDVATIVATALAVACGQSTPPELFDALTGGGAAAYMFAATGGALKAANGKAATSIPPGALPADALVLITPLAGYTLPTTLPQGGPYFSFSTSPSFVSFNNPVKVELTQTDPNSIISDNTILAHVPTGSSVILPVQSAACEQLGIGTYPVYSGGIVAPSAVSADAALGTGSPVVAATISGVRCGTVSSWSPFGAILIYRSSFPRTLLELQACGTSATGRRFRARNKANEEVVVFHAGTTNGTTYGKKTPIRLGPGSLASPSSAVFELPLGTTAARLYYGPLAVRTTAATAGAPSC